MFIPKLNCKCVFKYPFDADGGKKLSLAECFVYLATEDSISSYQCFSNQRQKKPETTKNCPKVLT